MIACIALPDQNNMKIASYSPHPPVHLPHHSKLSNIPGPSRSTLPLHSNWNHFRHVGVNGTQSTSQTLFPMQKNFTIWFWRRIHVHGIFSISYFQRHCSSELLCVYSWTERKNKYLLETIRAMMFGMNVPRLGRSCVDRNILDQSHTV